MPVKGIIERNGDTVGRNGGVLVEVRVSDWNAINGEIGARIVGNAERETREESGEAGVDGVVSKVGEGEALREDMVREEQEGAEMGGGHGGFGGDEEGGGDGED